MFEFRCLVSGRRLRGAVAPLLAVLLIACSAARVFAQDLYVQDSPSLTDTGPRFVLHYNGLTGAFIRELGADAPSQQPLGLAFGPDGNLYVGSASPAQGVLRFNPSVDTYVDTFIPNSAPLAGGVESILFRGAQVYVCQFGDSQTPGTVERFDAATGAYLGNLVPGGRGGLVNAGGMVFGPNGVLYVGNVNSRIPNSILRYNSASGAFLGSMPGDIANFTYSMAFGPDGDLYSASSAGIVRYSGTTAAFKGSFGAGGPNGRDLAIVFGPDGNLYSSREGVGVLRFDGQTGAYLGVFAPIGSGGLHRPFHMVFGGGGESVPEPSSILLLLAVLPTLAVTRIGRGKP